MIPESVKAYQDECEAVLSWVEPGKWLSSHDFDRKSREQQFGDRPRRVWRVTPETIVPPIWGDLYLAVLQEFQRAGIVEARERNGTIEYTRKPNGQIDS